MVYLLLNAESAPTNARQFSTLLTHDNLARLVISCNEASKDIKFRIYYGVSKNKWKFWDTSNSLKEINYKPEDDAESFR